MIVGGGRDGRLWLSDSFGIGQLNGDDLATLVEALQGMTVAREIRREHLGAPNFHELKVFGAVPGCS